MQATDYHPRGKPFTGRKMLASVLGFFGVIIAVNMVMLFSALGAWPGLVVPNSYIASQDFDAVRGAVAAREARGWQVGLTAPGGRAEIALAGPDGAPLTGLALTVAAARPASVAEDHTLAFTETAPGLYVAAGPLAEGRWVLTLTAEGAGAPYIKTLRLTVR